MLTNHTTSVQYRDIPGFPGYQAGDDGTIWSTKRLDGRRGWSNSGPRRRVRERIDRDGYTEVKLSIDGREFSRRVHRLILEAFVGPRPPRCVTRHFPDPTRTNNKLSNLQWGTLAENAADKVVHGTLLCGDKHHFAKLSVGDVREIRRLVSEGYGRTVVASMFSVGNNAVARIVNGESWRHLS